MNLDQSVAESQSQPSTSMVYPNPSHRFIPYLGFDGWTGALT